MPIYEYSCAKCGSAFEALQRMGDKTCPPCEKCGSKRTQRKFSTFAMHGSAHASSGSDGGHAHGHGGGSCGGCARSSCSGCHH